MRLNKISYKIICHSRTGKTPTLYFRIWVNQTRSGFSTGIVCTPLEYNTVTQDIKGSSSKTMQLKDIIKAFDESVVKLRKRSDLTPRMIWCDMWGKPYTPDAVETQETLGILCHLWNEAFEKKIAIGENKQRSLETYQNYQNLILAYFGADKEVSTFKTSHHEEFRLYLRGQTIGRAQNAGQNFSANYVSKFMQHFKKLFEFAYDMEWINKHPYTYKSSPRTKPEKLYLDTETFEAMQTLQTEDKATNEAIEIFNFCAYTGLSYVDYCTLITSYLVTQKGKLFIILPFRQKSPIAKRYGKSCIPILPEALKILQKYGMKPETMPRPESHVLNRHLKFALGLIGASPQICIKHARHTFINWSRNVLGLPEGTIATICGHASIKTTEQSYLNRGLDTVLKDLERLQII